MGELVFIGLGLHDEKGVTLRGLEDARGADVVFAELYTSTLAGASLESVERLVGKKIRILGRAEVEDGHTILAAAAGQRVAFLVGGDAIGLLLQMAAKIGTAEIGRRMLTCALSRVGSREGLAVAGPLGELPARDLGRPPHCLVIPGSLHFLEKEALIAFAGAPRDFSEGPSRVPRGVRSART